MTTNTEQPGDGTYALFGSFTTEADTRDALVTILLQAAAMMEQTDECLQYQVSTSKDPQKVWVYEVWHNKAAHDAALENEAVRSLIKQAMPLIKSMGEQTELSIQE